MCRALDVPLARGVWNRPRGEKASGIRGQAGSVDGNSGHNRGASGSVPDPNAADGTGTGHDEPVTVLSCLLPRRR